MACEPGTDISREPSCINDALWRMHVEVKLFTLVRTFAVFAKSNSDIKAFDIR